MATTYLFRQESDTRSDTVIETTDSPEEEVEEGLFCRQCGHYITSAKNGIEVNGSHHHTFFNPAGIIYEIGCFSNASGCLQYGPSSSEFAWFAGYTWRLSICTVCSAHLGWFFRSGDLAFYGLIVKNLTSG